MRARGINYDTGFINKGISSRDPFDIEVVKRELQIIRDDLHCNAVRVTGGDPERLDTAAIIAAELGLEVWFSPFTCDLTQQEMIGLLADCAERAERLRRQGTEIVLVMGAEISLLNKEFLPGDTIGERMELLSDMARLRGVIGQVPARVNDFFGRAVPVVRERFGGRITYASMPFEQVDWTPFDIVSTDIYQSAEVAEHFAASMRSYAAQDKPVAITEFGSVTYKGAGDRGARGWEIVKWDNDTVTPHLLEGDYIRDEAEQATYVRELLETFHEAGIDSTFVFTFVLYQYPHRLDHNQDLDLASYGIVKVYEDRFGATYPDMRWEPKAAFAAVADFYQG